MPARSRTALFQLPRIAKPSGTSSLGPSPSRSALFQLPRIAKPSGTSPAISPARSSPLFQLPRIAKPSGTSPLRCSFGWWQITSFQLPRIAKPSGTPLAAGTARRLLGHVSTSPDSKAIRNLGSIATGWPGGFSRFQLPRIAKPSGTPLLLAIRRAIDNVSTSPDSKAIRNAALLILAIFVSGVVSTSPDSKAIRNPTGQPGSAPAGGCFNFPG